MYDHEGGTSYDINDRGGLTRFGISKKQYPTVDIANLTKEQADVIYTRDYWLKNKCHLMPTPLAIVVFDSSVNCGVGSGAIWLQKAINAGGDKISVDGSIGPETLSRLDYCDPYNLSGKIVGHRMLRYSKLISRDPSQRGFVTGWIKRASDLLEFI
jgi:lysozyme family protein